MLKFSVLLFLFFPVFVYAEDDVITYDKLKIENMDVKIFYRNNNVKIKKNIDMKVTYGSSKDLYFVNFRIPDIYELYNINKGSQKYVSEESQLYVETKSEFNIFNDNGTIIELGTFRSLFQEKEEIEYGYLLSFNENIRHNTSFPITYSDYDISHLDFNIYINEEDLDKKIKFSFNNLDFKENLPGLNIKKNEKELSIIGEYTNEIPAGKTLYFMIEDKNITNFSFLKYIILVLTIPVFIFIFRFFLLTKNKKNV